MIQTIQEKLFMAHIWKTGPQYTVRASAEWTEHTYTWHLGFLERAESSVVSDFQIRLIYINSFLFYFNGKIWIAESSPDQDCVYKICE